MWLEGQDPQKRINMALGRISGPMLKANLERLGVNLAFDTDLLYLDVNASRIGINNTNPQYALDVNGSYTTDVIAADSADINGILINSNTITSTAPNLTFSSPDNVIYQNKLIVDGLSFDGTTISSNDSNANIEISPNGVGSIELLASTNVTGDMHVIGNITTDGDLIIGGDITIGDSVDDTLVIVASIDSDLIPVVSNTYDLGSLVQGWKTLYATEAYIDSIHINGNVIETIDSNADLDLRAAGTGVIIVDDLTFENNTISSTSGNLILESQSEIITMNTAGAVVLPRGTTLERPGAPLAGMIRYNTDTSGFEGYTNAAWTPLDGVRDLDGNTYITAELTPGANDDTIRFYTDGILRADITSTRARFDKLEIDDISIDGNVISTVSTNQDMQLSPNGTGVVVVEDFEIDASSITNTVSNAAFTFEITGDSYYKFSGTNGIVIPVGSSIQRPAPGNTETGQLRWNTDNQAVEVYSGASWGPVTAGAGGNITESDATDLAIEYALLLG
jgi:hypothetical protein